MSLIPVKGTKMFRDSSSGALINKDYSGLEEYNKKRLLISNQKAEINTLKSEIDSIKTDMSEIKQLMLQLLNKE